MTIKQALPQDLTKRGIVIISTEENIGTADDSAVAKLFRRMMLAQGAYQVGPTSERIRAGAQRARAEGKRLGCPPALASEDVKDCRHLYASGTGYSLRQIAKLKKESKATVKKAVEAGADAISSQASGFTLKTHRPAARPGP